MAWDSSTETGVSGGGGGARLPAECTCCSLHAARQRFYKEALVSKHEGERGMTSMYVYIYRPTR